MGGTFQGDPAPLQRAGTPQLPTSPGRTLRAGRDAQQCCRSAFGIAGEIKSHPCVSQIFGRLVSSLVLRGSTTLARRFGVVSIPECHFGRSFVHPLVGAGFKGTSRYIQEPGGARCGPTGTSATPPRGSQPQIQAPRLKGLSPGIEGSRESSQLLHPQHLPDQCSAPSPP